MKKNQHTDASTAIEKPAKNISPGPSQSKEMPVEVGGPKGPEPTRYGDWECKGRCSDF